MHKTLFPTIMAMSLALFMSTACAERDTGEESAAQAAANADQGTTSGSAGSLMNQPVDFSSPEAVETTLNNIREHEGEAAYRRVMGAVDYLLFYDLSVKNNKEKLYKKLDGQTPNQIIAKGRR